MKVFASPDCSVSLRRRDGTGSAQAPLGEVCPWVRNPVFIGDDGKTDRMFVIEQRGKIRIVRMASFNQGRPRIRKEVDFGGEKGLLGLAFHPDFEKTDCSTSISPPTVQAHDLHRRVSRRSNFRSRRSSHERVL